MIDLDSQIKDLRLFNPSNGTWKSYLQYILRKNGGFLLFNCNHNMVHVEITSKFYRELLQWWADFRESFAEEKDWQLIIWNNKEVLIDNKPVYYRQYFRAGIICVHDLHFDVGNLTSFNRITSLIDKSNFLTWTGLRNSVPPKLRNLDSNVTFDLSKPSFKYSECVFDVSKAKSKHYYTLLVGAKARLPNNSMYLQREFNITKDQLEKSYHLPHTVTCEPYLKAFQYKVLNTIVYINDKLYKIGYIENYYCSFCNHEKETLYHLLFHCPHSNKFWKAFELYIFQVTSQQISLNLKDVILGVISSICPKLKTLNYLIIIGKLYLWDCRRNGVLPNVACFRAKVNIKIQTEKYISARNKTIHKFCDKWKFFI